MTWNEKACSRRSQPVPMAVTPLATPASEPRLIFHIIRSSVSHRIVKKISYNRNYKMIKSSPVIFLLVLITPNNASYGLNMNKKLGQTLSNGSAPWKGFTADEGDLIAIWNESKSLESVAFNCGLIVGRLTVVCTTSQEAFESRTRAEKNKAQSGL